MRRGECNRVCETRKHSFSSLSFMIIYIGFLTREERCQFGRYPRYFLVVVNPSRRVGTANPLFSYGERTTRVRKGYGRPSTTNQRAPFIFNRGMSCPLSCALKRKGPAQQLVRTILQESGLLYISSELVDQLPSSAIRYRSKQNIRRSDRLIDHGQS